MPQRDSETGLLVFETPEEKNAVRLVLGMPGWRHVESAFQLHIQTVNESVMGLNTSGENTDFECGRRIGFEQGRVTQFNEVLLDILEQLTDEPPDPEAGKDTAEGDSLGLPSASAAELKEVKDVI